MKPSQNSSTTTPNATTQASPIFSNTYRQHIEPDTFYTNIQFFGLEPNTLYHFTFRVVLYEGSCDNSIKNHMLPKYLICIARWSANWQG